MSEIRLIVELDTVLPDSEIIKMLQMEGIQDNDMLAVISIKIEKRIKAGR